MRAEVTQSPKKLGFTPPRFTKMTAQRKKYIKQAA